MRKFGTYSASHACLWSLFGDNALCDGEIAGVSSEGGVWVMCRLGSAAIPSLRDVTDVEEARVEYE